MPHELLVLMKKSHTNKNILENKKKHFLSQTHVSKLYIIYFSIIFFLSTIVKSFSKKLVQRERHYFTGIHERHIQFPTYPDIVEKRDINFGRLS